MKRTPFPQAIYVIFAVLMFHPVPASAASPEAHPAVPAILSAAESLFQAMKARDYPAIFAALSAKSRETIVAETSTALAEAAKQPPPGKKTAADPPSAPAKDAAPDREAVRLDFIAGGTISKEYWTAFLRRFEPDDALERSRWEMGTVEKDRAEVLITRQGSDRPAALRMFRENDGWRVGLVETFWSR